jgi:hypothetical protein
MGLPIDLLDVGISGPVNRLKDRRKNAVTNPSPQELTCSAAKSPAVRGVEWLTQDRMALDKVPRLYVRPKAWARDGQGQEDG